RATRLAQFLNTDDKEYVAVIRLGYSTDTGDRTGEPICATGFASTPAENEIEVAMSSLRGYIDQVPPMYSAKKIQGKKLYELARRGEEVERKPVRVCIHEFTAIRPDWKLIVQRADATCELNIRVE